MRHPWVLLTAGAVAATRVVAVVVAVVRTMQMGDVRGMLIHTLANRVEVPANDGSPAAGSREAGDDSNRPAAAAQSSATSRWTTRTAISSRSAR